MAKTIQDGVLRKADFARQDDEIATLTWSPGGDLLAVASRNASASVWEFGTRTRLWQIATGSFHIYNMRWSPDGTRIAISCDDALIRILDSSTGTEVYTINVLQGNTPAIQGEFAVMALDWSPDGRTLASGSTECLQLWDAVTGTLLYVSVEQRDLNKLAFSPNGVYIASTSYEHTVCIWDVGALELLQRYSSSYYPALSWSPDSHLLATAQETSIEIRDIGKNAVVQILEAHSERVKALAFSPDGKFLASRSGMEEDGDDRRLLIWRCDEWKICTSLPSPSGYYLFSGLAFSPKRNVLVASTAAKTVSVWEFDPDTLIRLSANIRVIYYKNAKIALVGNSGVGKSGLALVLTSETYAPTDSTHGRKVVEFERTDHQHSNYKHEIREAVLWDFAGQPGYRLIHQLHLDDVDVGVIVFDSKDETDPLSGIRHWNKALDYAHTFNDPHAQVHKKLLVAARVDRGPIGVGTERIQRLLEELGIEKYVETSAKEGTGIAELKTAIKDIIPWSELPTVSSNRRFQQFGDFIRQQRNLGSLLATQEELKSNFTLLTGSQVAPQLFNTYLERLQRLGLVRRFSFGNIVLLKPELLDAYAAAIVFAAKREPDGMGAVLLSKITPGQIEIPKADRILTPEQEQLLLAATTEDLLRHEVALKESSPEGELLIFPSELTRENPELPDPEGKTMRVNFSGPITNIYASLVVRLSHSELFKLSELWRNAAVFSTSTGHRVGFLLLESGDGEAALIIFSQASREEATQRHFERYVVSHLSQRASVGTLKIDRFVFCPDLSCRSLIPALSIEKRKGRGFDWITCGVCDSRVSLSESDQANEPSMPSIQNARINDAANARKEQSADYVSASGEMLSPNFISWAGAERATVALVFSDVVGSTALGMELGDDDMSVVRRLHFRQARTIIQRRGGYEIKTIGDSFMVAFKSANEGFEFALDLLNDPGPRNLELRAGIHVGPIQIDENDAFGSMVNYAARVVSSIKGAGVTVSDRAFQDLNIQGSKRFRIFSWTKREAEQFKGFSGPQIVWDCDL